MEEERYLEIDQLLEEAGITPPDSFPENKWFVTTAVIRRDGDRIISKEEVIMNEYIENVAKRVKVNVDELVAYHGIWKANKRVRSAGA